MTDPTDAFLAGLARQLGKPPGQCTGAELIAAATARLAAATAVLDQLKAADADAARCGTCPIHVPLDSHGRSDPGRAHVTHTCHLAAPRKDTP